MRTITTLFFDLRSYFLIISLLLLAGVSSAQHVKVIDGTRLGAATPSGHVKASAQTAQIWRNVNGTWTQLSSDSVGLAVFAGKTVRLRIASTNNRGKLIVGVDSARIADARNGTLYVGTDRGVYHVACEGAASPIGAVAGAQLTISGTISDPVLNWKTEKDWKGTCRMLTVKLRDGSEVRARVRFE